MSAHLGGKNPPPPAPNTIAVYILRYEIRHTELDDVIPTYLFIICYRNVQNMPVNAQKCLKSVPKYPKMAPENYLSKTLKILKYA